MAGGNANDLRAPYPKGEDGWVCIPLGPVSAGNGETGATKFATTVPFGFYPRKAYFSAQVVTSDPTITIQDDTGTPQVIVSAVTLTAIVDESSAVQDLTITEAVKATQINAGAELHVLITTDAGDVVTLGQVLLWVKPAN
jgi:hypothetical protein